MSNFDRAFIKAYDKSAESTEPQQRASTRDVLLSISLRDDDGRTQRIEQPTESAQGHVAGPHLDPASLASGQEVAMSNVALPPSSVIVLPTGELEPKGPTEKEQPPATKSPGQAPAELNEAEPATASRMHINLDHIRQIRELEAERAQRAEARRLAEQTAAEEAAAEQVALAKAEALREEQRLAEQRAAEQRAAEQRAAEQRAAEQRAAEQRAAEQRAAEQRAAEQRAEAERLAEQQRAEQLAALHQQTVFTAQPFTTFVDSVSRAPVAEPQPVEEQQPAVAEPAIPAHELNLAPEPASAPVESGQIQGGTFEPAWEVDRITWPAVSDLLLQTQLDYFAEAGDQLRDSAADGLNVLAVSSELRGEGRSTVAMCLARSAAAAGVRVALLDADFDSPHLASQLNLSEAPGWDGVLDGSTPLSEAAVQSVEDNVCVVPLSLDAVHTGLAPSHSAVTSLIRRVADQFDLVIIDSGPLGESQRVLFEGGDRCPIDAAVLVRDTRRIEATDQQHNIRLWRALGVKAVGAVENFLPN